jgi:hypothetical protein
VNTMKRREFLIGAGLAAGAGKLRADRSDQARLDRIAIMSLCFNPVIKSAAHPDDPKRTLDILDLPDMIAERYGVHHVELQHAHFASTEPGYLEEYRGRLKKAKSQMNQISCWSRLLLFAVVLNWKWHRELMWNQKRLIPKDIAERWQHNARCKSEHFTAFDRRHSAPRANVEAPRRLPPREGLPHLPPPNDGAGPWGEC